MPTVTCCNKGVTGKAGRNVLQNLGFTRVCSLSGGSSNYRSSMQGVGAAEVPEPAVARQPKRPEM